MPAEQHFFFKLNNTRRRSIVLYRAIHFIVKDNEIQHTNCSFLLLSFMMHLMFVVEVIQYDIKYLQSHPFLFSGSTKYP